MLTECKLCKSGNVVSLYRSRRYFIDVGRCTDCGLIFVLDSMSESQLRAMYSDEHAFSEFADLMRSDKVLARHGAAVTELTFMLGDEFHNQEPYRYPRLFDVGAGAAEFLKLARDAEFEVHGNEFSASAIHQARERYKIELVSTSLEDDDRSNYFDVVTMWGLIEHVTHPESVLKHAHRLLRRGGILYIYTPVWCLYDTIGLWLVRVSGGRWTRLLDRRITLAHLQLFSRPSLEGALQRVGFDVLKMNTVCEYNLPVTAYLESLGAPAGVRDIFATLLDQFIDRGLFFRNNMRVFCRKK